LGASTLETVILGIGVVLYVSSGGKLFIGGEPNPG